MFNPLSTTKSLVFIGSGGVGKTTLAASVALGEALRGKRVFILTIDPSQRLAQALGFKPDGQHHIIQNSQISAAGGELTAAVLDHNAVFEEFIFRASKKENSAADMAQLQKNKLYRQLSTKLTGSQDFTSLYKLSTLVREQKYDLVILDTPPAQHTWQFLEAPEKIGALFNEGIASWFRQNESKGLFKKILNLGTQKVLDALKTLTGSEFIKELSLFFEATQKWQTHLEADVIQCHQILTSQTTEFVLVTGLDSSRMSEAEKISSEVYKQGYKITSLIFNRFPDWLLNMKDAQIVNSKNEKRLLEIKGYYNLLVLDFESNMNSFQKNLVLYKSPEVRQSQIDILGLINVYESIQKIKI